MLLYKEIEKTFPAIEKVFSKEELLCFKDASPIDLYLYHFGLGTWIRNNLLHPENSVLYNFLIENGIEDSDDMSTLIILLFHYHVSNKI